MIGIDNSVFQLVQNRLNGKEEIISKIYSRKAINKDLVFVKNKHALAILSLSTPKECKLQQAIYTYNLKKEFRQKTKIFYQYAIKSIFKFSAPVKINANLEKGFYADIPAFNNFTSTNIEFVQPIKPFKDKINNISNEFFCYEDMKDLDFANLILEKKEDGIRIQIHKDLNKVSAYTFFGNRIPNNKIQHILDEVKQLNYDILILDGELISDTGKDVYSIISNKDITTPDKSLRVKVFDILNTNGTYHTEELLYERKMKLEKVSDEKYISKVKYLTIKSYENFKDIIKATENKSIEGFVLKDTSSTYKKEDSKKWYKLIFPRYLMKNLTEPSLMNEDSLYEVHYNLHRMARKFSEGKHVASWTMEQIISTHNKIVPYLDHKIKINKIDSLDAHLEQDLIKTPSITTKLLEGYTDSQVIGTHFKLHVAFGNYLRHGITSGKEMADLVNAHYRITKEFERRHFTHHYQDALDDATLKYLGTMKPEDSILPFIREKNLQYTKNISDYTPKSRKTVQLKDDWRFLSNEYVNALKGQKTKYSLKELTDIGLKVYKELTRRGTKFHSNKMKKYSRQFYNKIIALHKRTRDLTNFRYVRVNPSGKVDGERIFIKDILPHFQGNIKLAEPYVYIVGGVATHEKEGTTGDIDILIKKEEPENPNEDRALKFRILRALPEKLRPRVHFLYDTLHGPFTNHYPIWDLELVPNTDHRLHEMSLVDNTEAKWQLIDKAGNLASFATAKFLVCPDGTKQEITSNIREDVLKLLDENSVSLLIASDLTDYTMECLGSIGIQWELVSPKNLSHPGFKLGKFHTMPKPTHGRSKEEIYTPLSVINVIKSKPEWEKELEENGLYIEKKYDGIRAQVHKINEKINIWSDEGNIITNKVPTLKEQFLKINGDFEAEFEIELYKDGKHQPRAVTSGIIHSKEVSPDEKYLQAHVYDTLYFNGKELVKEPYSIRLEYIYKFKGKNIFHTDPIIAKDLDDVRNAIEKKSKLPGSEGAMIKMPSHIYDFDGKTDKVLKYKNEVSIFARIKKKHKVAGTENTFFYDCVVGSPKDEAYIGRTFNTNIDAKEGETIEVIVVEISQYDDKGKLWFNWWSPRVIRHRGKEDAFSIKRVKEIVQETTGTEEKKRMPKSARSLFDLEKTEEKLDYSDVYLKIPDESKTYNYVIHAHARGRSVHLDLRIQFSDKYLIGYTLFVPKGFSRDATSFEDAKELYNKEIKPIVDDKFHNPLTKFNCKLKQVEPIEWLTAEGWVEPGEIGATKKEAGQFIIVDKGTVQYGAQKSQYHEYFFDGKLLNGKFSFRELENKSEWKKTPEGYFTWMGFPSNSPPYMLTLRSINKDYVPEKGIKAIPKKLASKIPKQYQYWNYDERSKRKQIRLDLINAIKKQPFPIQKAMLIDYNISNATIFWYGTLGSGKQSKTHKLNTSALLSTDKIKIRINAGIDYLGKLKEGNPDAIILTGISPKHIGALKNKIDIPIYGTKEMEAELKRLNYPNEIHVFDRHLTLAGVKIEAIGKEATALKIDIGPCSFAYALDHSNEELLKGNGIDVLILDARNVVTQEAKTTSLKTNLQNAVKYNIPNLLITNFSEESIKLEPHLESWIERLTKGRSVSMLANDNDTFGFSNEINTNALNYANSAKYVLQHRYWKGPVVIRKGPSKQVYDLRIKEPGKDTYSHFILQHNLIDTSTVAGILRHDKNIDMFTYSGELKPGHPENRTKNTPAWIRKLTSGTATILKDTSDLKQIKFTSGKLKGIYTATRQNKTWILKKDTDAPKTTAWQSHSFTIRELSKETNDTWEAIGFAPGVWNGITYSEEVVKNAPKPNGLNIVRDHSDDVIHQVGKILSSRWDDDLKAMIIKFKITNSEVNKQLATRQIRGVSMRCWTDSYKDNSNNEIAIKIIGWGHAALVMEPACDICTILY